jgi:hypothetical protein
VEVLNRLSEQFWTNRHKLSIGSKSSSANSNNNNNSKNKVKFPHIFEYSKFNFLTGKVLKCVLHFVCLLDICLDFVSRKYHLDGRDGGDHEWVQLITEMFNNHYKSENIKIECLALFTNVLLVVTKDDFVLRGRARGMHRASASQCLQSLQNERS